MSDWLVGTLIATSVLIALVLLVRQPVRRRFGSRVTYGLWLIPAARLFMPTLTNTVEGTLPAQSIGPLPQPLASESLWMARLAPADPSLADRVGGWPTVILAVWLSVAASLFFIRMVAYRRDRRAILNSAVAISHDGFVRIVRTPEVVSPVALGIVDRIVAIPIDFEHRYAERERGLVMAHELAHHRSGDLIANLFAFVLLCLQWFNPLAWAAHAAFRFVQEAACDARVLDKAAASDRAEYGRAIAKAASGRALLFASALDHRNSLHRRLHSMLRSPNPASRFAGRILIVAAIGVALPLTASRAVDYIDLPASPAPVVRPAAAAMPAPVVAAAAAVQPMPPVAPVPPAPPVPPREFNHNMTINGGMITIDGKTKRWEELTPAEKARVRSAVAKARAGLAKAHFDRDRALRDVAKVKAELHNGDLQRQMAQAQAAADEAMHAVEVHAREIRWSGRDPEALKQQIRVSVSRMNDPDLKRTLEELQGGKVEQDLGRAEQSMRDARVELDRIEVRIRQDERK
jgi:beta-lactamase regulating signal transducer with metallopeptidase domain